MEAFMLENAEHISFLARFFEHPELECLSSCSRGLAGSLLRDIFFQHSLVVVPVRHQNPQAVRATVQALSPLVRRVATSDPTHLASLARLPLLSMLRIAKPPLLQDESESWLDSEPIRFTYETTVALWRLTRVVQLELDSWVQGRTMLFRDMMHLRVLDLEYRYDTGSLDTLTHLYNLHTLRVRGDNLHNLHALSRLPQLLALQISSYGVHTIAPLQHLVQLEQLDLSRSNVSDLSPISGLTRLHWLKLEDTRVADLQPLSQLTSLKMLSLARSEVMDLRPLAALAATLQWLDLSGCTLTHVRALQQLHQLETLRMEKTAWSTLATEPDVSSTLERLQRLRCIDGRVVVTLRAHVTISRGLCLESLARLGNLERLDLTSDCFARSPNIPTLIVLPSLVKLRIEWNYTPVDDIPLAAVMHPRLQSLQLVNVRLRNLRNLQYAPELQDLRLLDVYVDDLSMLRLATRLTHFTITCAMVHQHHTDDGEDPHTKPPTHDLQPLRFLPKLRYLDLSYTSILHLHPLQDLHQLRFVDLSSTDVTDVASLWPLRFLECIRLRDTEISRFEPGAFCSALRELALPEHVNCLAIRQQAPLLRKLLHPNRNCLWVGHDDGRDNDPGMEMKHAW